MKIAPTDRPLEGQQQRGDREHEERAERNDRPDGRGEAQRQRLRHAGEVIGDCQHEPLAEPDQHEPVDRAMHGIDDARADLAPARTERALAEARERSGEAVAVAVHEDQREDGEQEHDEPPRRGGAEMPAHRQQRRFVDGLDQPRGVLRVVEIFAPPLGDGGSDVLQALDRLGHGHAVRARVFEPNAPPPPPGARRTSRRRPPARGPRARWRARTGPAGRRAARPDAAARAGGG